MAEDPGTLTIDQVDPNTGLIEGDFAFTTGHFRIYAPSVFILE